MKNRILNICCECGVDTREEEKVPYNDFGRVFYLCKPCFLELRDIYIKSSDRTITHLRDSDMREIFFGASDFQYYSDKQDEDSIRYVKGDRILNYLENNPDIAKEILEAINYENDNLDIDIEEERRNEKRIEEERKREKELEEQNKQERIYKAAIEPIHKLIGMNNVKKQLDSWILQDATIERLKKETNLNFDKVSRNIVITGSSGVGKTELARLLVKVLHVSGHIKEEKMKEVAAQDLVAGYIGHTAAKTEKVILEAMDGVLFIDESYRLSEGFSNSDRTANFGLEAIETIMGYMDNPNILFIFSGYQDKMDEFLESNEGLRSRIKTYFNLSDYTLDELTEIGVNSLTSKGYIVDEAKEMLRSCINKEMKQGILKGNGRTVHYYLSKIIDAHLNRLIHNGDGENPHLLLPEDVKSCFEKMTESNERLKATFDDAKKQINELIGMNSVKKEVQKIGAFQYIQEKRRKRGMPVKSKNNHMVFKGNPGTGKTTLARLISQLFRGANVLSNGHLVEATKDMLTNGDIPKTVKNLVNKAKGGILFIDEAYTLANDGKGKEALDALIPLLENRRDEFICILAGYDKDMDRLFELNEGLKSRMAYHFLFEDYSSEELYEMSLRLIDAEGYMLTEESKTALQSIIRNAKYKNEVNGNGRWIRNLFEQALKAQSERLFELETSVERELTDEEHNILTTSDIVEGHYVLSTMDKNKKEKITA